MMKIDVYFTVIALLVAELSKVLIYANQICVTSQKVHKVVRNHKKLNICANTKSKGFKFCKVGVLQQLLILIVVMMSPWQHTRY